MARGTFDAPRWAPQFEKWVEGAASDALAKLQSLTPQVEELSKKLPGKESAAQK